MTYTPGDNTLVYFPFKDSNDTLVGSAIRSYSSNVTYTTEYGGVANGGGLSINYYSNKKSYATFSVWVKGNAYMSGGQGSYPRFTFSPTGATFYDAAWGRTTSVSFEEGWHNIVISNYGSEMHKKVYVDGEFKQITYSDNSLSGNSYSEGIFSVTGGFLSEWIVEDVNWTEEQIVAYYNENKSRFEFTPDIDHGDTQGPCPDGFHVPTSDERKTVFDAGVALGAWSESDGSQMRSIIKMPLAGCRYFSDAGLTSPGSNGYYWSSSASTSTVGYSYYLTLTSSNITPQSSFPASSGYSIRPFKNVPAVPTSEWTMITNGIYWFQSEGLISISSDGTNWITMADKNLGATQVYNYSSELTEDNCGKFYQWGNNNGFSRNGSVTTSSTRVDASGYGPGNYYSRNTFVTTSSPNYSWDTSDNRNLWGGETDRRVYPPYEGNELCFTANTAGSTLQLTKTGSPTDVSLETSTDGYTWTNYTIGNTITLANAGDKVYMRNKSTTPTSFGYNQSNYYKFKMSGSIAASGDINYLSCKTSTTTIAGAYQYVALFQDCTSLTSCPELPATTLKTGCYYSMFQGCTNLETLPQLPATYVEMYSYAHMFRNCSKITLSLEKTDTYKYSFRIPYQGTGSWYNADSVLYMFQGESLISPALNTVYYTSNKIIPDTRPAFSYTGIFWYDETDTEYENPLKPSQTTTTPIAGYPDVTETIGNYLNRVSLGWDVISGYNFSKISILNHDGDVIKTVDVNYIPTLDDFDNDGGKNSLSILISFKKKKAIRKVKKIINNGNTYKAGVQYPDGGEEGQVLMKTNTGTGWCTPEAGIPGIGVDNIVVCTESEYSSATYENGIFYFVRED